MEPFSEGFWVIMGVAAAFGSFGLLGIYVLDNKEKLLKKYGEDNHLAKEMEKKS